MFKATFPYATLAEEEAERHYIKSLKTTSENETAGNVWISPEHALELAKEYGITMWIRALLDPTPIEVNAGRDATPKKISPPPAFNLPPLGASAKKENKVDANGEVNPKTGEALRRSRRSVSPVKSMPPTKRIATPRKSKKAATVGAASSSDSLKQALHAAANATESSPGAESSVAGTEQDNESAVSRSETATPVKFKAGGDKSTTTVKKSQEEKVVVHVDQDVKFDNGEETTHTHVEVEMPEALFAPMPKVEDTASLIAEATRMVEAAVKANNMTQGSDTMEDVKAKAALAKRKADDMAVDDDEDEENQELDSEGMPVVKRARVLEREVKKEKVKTRALIGISATLAIGYVIFIPNHFHPQFSNIETVPLFHTSLEPFKQANSVA